MTNKLRAWLIGVIAAVWALNFTAPIFISGFQPPGEIHVVFMTLVSGLLAGWKKEEEKKKEVAAKPKKRAPAKKTTTKEDDEQ